MTVTNWREFGDAISQAIGYDKVGQAQPVGTVDAQQISPNIRRVVISIDLITPYEAKDQDIPF